MQKGTKVKGFACDVTVPSDKGDVRLVLSVRVVEDVISTMRCNIGYVGTNKFGAWGVVHNVSLSEEGVSFAASGFGNGDDVGGRRTEVTIQGVVNADKTVDVVVTDLLSEFLEVKGTAKKGFVNIVA